MKHGPTIIQKFANRLADRRHEPADEGIIASHASNPRDPIVQATPSTNKILDREESENKSEEEKVS